jgi:hypothetical protein
MGVFVEDEINWFLFLDRNDREGIKGHAREVLQKMGCLDVYTYENGRFAKSFKFPSQDKDLIEHIKAFKGKLCEVLKNKQ